MLTHYALGLQLQVREVRPRFPTEQLQGSAIIGLACLCTDRHELATY